MIRNNNKDDFEAEETPAHHDLIRSNTKDDFEAEETPEPKRATTTITRPYGGWGGISDEGYNPPSVRLAATQPDARIGLHTYFLFL